MFEPNQCECSEIISCTTSLKEMEIRDDQKNIYKNVSKIVDVTTEQCHFNLVLHMIPSEFCSRLLCYLHRGDQLNLSYTCKSAWTETERDEAWMLVGIKRFGINPNGNNHACFEIGWKRVVEIQYEELGFCLALFRHV